MKKTIYSFFILFILVSVSACSPGSKITGSWKSPKVTAPYQNIMVAGLSENMSAKSTVENDMAAALSNKEIIVSKSIDVFPRNFTSDVSKEEMLRKVRQKGSDAIITITMVDKQTDTRYVPGSYGYVPMGISRGFLGYYTYWYPTVYSPGYYAEDKTYFIETNVYNTRDGELVWSAQSETYNPADLSGFSEELANIIVNKLEKDGVIGRKTLKVKADQNSAMRNK